MVFKVLILKRAQKEIENSVDYYKEINIDLALKFYNALEKTYHEISINPYYQKKSGEFKAIPVKKFPFLLFYKIDEDKQVIKILSCFHTSRNSKKYPK